ncbi:TIR domain-containing protein [Nesterenkonia sandarakina]|uniref:Thoeris protein ThsB TIR-like domain-containing protein n=1 Tax=Nesterenkonia sandarakina TaxID=272918 RepID=A0A7Z0J4J4_9MICC|nr:TIR domain-containing protein [Nesterenkonia sandarakina]NYJ18141.1 hypothetical protein [Nesterenkonia sandarakina]
MPRSTFFSFHPEHEPFRSTIVCESPQLEERHKAWIRSSRWNRVSPADDSTTAHLLLKSLKHTAVTAVLIGPDTTNHRWVQHLIEISRKRGNGLFGIYLHNIKNEEGQIAPKGENPLPPGCPTYDWVFDHGPSNLAAWVDAAYYAP